MPKRPSIRVTHKLKAGVPVKCGLCGRVVRPNTQHTCTKRF